MLYQSDFGGQGSFYHWLGAKLLDLKERGKMELRIFVSLIFASIIYIFLRRKGLIGSKKVPSCREKGTETINHLETSIDTKRF